MDNTNKIESYIGETRIMKSRWMATCIAYRDASDMDVRFDDGVIVNHVTAYDFAYGNVPHKVCAFRYVGMQVKTINGHTAECIAYRNYRDVDVRLEDGTIYRHQRCSDFAKGLIPKKTGRKEKPADIKNKKSSVHAGEEKMMQCGFKARCITYRNSGDADFLFSDGTLNCHRPYSQFGEEKMVPKPEAYRPFVSAPVLDLMDRTAPCDDFAGSFHRVDAVGYINGDTITDYQNLMKEGILKTRSFFTPSDGVIYELIRNLANTDFGTDEYWKASFRFVPYVALMRKRILKEREEIIRSDECERLVREAAWLVLHNNLIARYADEETMLDLIPTFEPTYDDHHYYINDMWNRFVCEIEDVPSEVKRLYLIDKKTQSTEFSKWQKRPSGKRKSGPA